MAKAEDSRSGKGGMIALMIPAFIAVAGGAGLGLYLGDLQKKDDAHVQEQHSKIPKVETADAHGEHKSGHGEAPAHKTTSPDEPTKLILKALPAIVTNLAVPPTALIRIQSAIIYDSAKMPNPDIFASELSSDIVAFLKTVSMSSIEGAGGLRELNENLTELATIRSNQAVREFVIESMVIQ